MQARAKHSDPTGPGPLGSFERPLQEGSEDISVCKAELDRATFSTHVLSTSQSARAGFTQPWRQLARPGRAAKRTNSFWGHVST